MNQVIIISGSAGTGKSTVAKALARRFKLRHISAGGKMRELAKELGFNTKGREFLKFYNYLRNHSSIDRKLDREIIHEVKEGSCVIESRLAAYIIKLPSFKILLKVPDSIAARRIALRDGISKSEALNIIRKRNKEDLIRYKKLYNININDYSIYDMILDTSFFNIKDMNSIIINAVSKVLK